MSRIAKNSIKLPSDTKCTFENNILSISGKLGSLNLPIDNIFDIKDADYIPKPALIPYKKVVNKFKIIPHNTIMIDDIKANLVTAKKLGIGTVLVKKNQPKLTKNIIDYSFSDIASIIKKINNKEIFNEN